MLDPRHRVDCADFFRAPHQRDHLNFKIPVNVISEIELAASRAGRTWNDQICYITGIFLGWRTLDFDDARSVEDWRTLMTGSMVQLDEAGKWFPFNCVGRK